MVLDSAAVAAAGLRSIVDVVDVCCNADAGSEASPTGTPKIVVMGLARRPGHASVFVICNANRKAGRT